jgi:hypothetical protein
MRCFGLVLVVEVVLQIAFNVKLSLGLSFHALIILIRYSFNLSLDFTVSPMLNP